MILSPTEKPQEARCLQTVAIHIWSMAKVPKVFPIHNQKVMPVRTNIVVTDVLSLATILHFQGANAVDIG